MRTKNNQIVSLSLVIWIFYIFWDFLFTKTVFSGQVGFLSQGLMLFVILSVVIVIVQKGSLTIDRTILVWIPFILYTIVSYLWIGEFNKSLPWIISLLFLVISFEHPIASLFKREIIFRFGIIVLVGILVQIVLKDFYNSYIARLFTNSENIIRGGYLGRYRGFTYQTGTSASILCHALAICFCFTSMFKKKHVRGILIVLLMIGVFLTQKRTHLAMIVLIPILVYVISEKNIKRKLKYVLIAAIVLLIVVLFFLNNVDFFSNYSVFNKIILSVERYEDGEDYTSGRIVLTQQAIELFEQHPITGIGLGQFKLFTTENTDVHNTYVQILCEQGIIGFILFVIPVLSLLLSNIKAIRRSNEDNSVLKYTLFVQLLFIIYSFTGNQCINLMGFAMYFLAVSIFYNYRRNSDLS